MNRFIITSLLSILWATQTFAAVGILFYSTSGSSYVEAMPYETLTSPAAHITYITLKGGQRIQVRSAGILSNLPLPAGSQNYTVIEAAAHVRQCEQLGAKYPQYAKMLKDASTLWKRALEISKMVQPETNVKSESGENIASPGVATEIPLIRTKSGNSLKNATITRFENDNAVIMHSEGVGKFSISDFANVAALPAEVRAAIIVAQAKVNAAKNLHKSGGVPEKTTLAESIKVLETSQSKLEKELLIVQPTVKIGKQESQDETVKNNDKQQITHVEEPNATQAAIMNSEKVTQEDPVKSQITPSAMTVIAFAIAILGFVILASAVFFWIFRKN